MENCSNPVLYEIISKGKPIIPYLINKMTDTEVLEERHVPFLPFEYTVADLAYVAIREMIADIPTYELLGVPFNEECGWCSYWYHLGNKKNRKKFQKAVRKWYKENKDNLVWVESSNWVTGDCLRPHPAGGHYVLQKKQ